MEVRAIKMLSERSAKVQREQKAWQLDGLIIVSLCGLICSEALQGNSEMRTTYCSLHTLYRF